MFYLFRIVLNPLKVFLKLTCHFKGKHCYYNDSITDSKLLASKTSKSCFSRASFIAANVNLIENSDSTIIPVECINVVYSVDIKQNGWKYNVDAKFMGAEGTYTSHNWTPRFYLKKDFDKLTH